MESGVYLLLFLLTVNLSGHARAQVTIEVIESDKIESEVNGGILIIYMHEEIAVPFKFATFTYTGKASIINLYRSFLKIPDLLPRETIYSSIL